MIKGKKTGQDDGNYTKIPNNILKARNLSSNAVRVLGLLIDRQSALDSAGKLREDNLFYMVASAFDDAMDISGTQVQRTILPELESKGLITRHRCPQDADSVYRRYTFYSLNWDRIYTYDGSQKDVTKEIKKKAKGRKAQEVLRARQAMEEVTEASPEVIAEPVTEPVAETDGIMGLEGEYELGAALAIGVFGISGIAHAFAGNADSDFYKVVKMQKIAVVENVFVYA